MNHSSTTSIFSFQISKVTPFSSKNLGNPSQDLQVGQTPHCPPLPFIRYITTHTAFVAPGWWRSRCRWRSRDFANNRNEHIPYRLALLKMSFLLPRWDKLVLWRVLEGGDIFIVSFSLFFLVKGINERTEPPMSCYSRNSFQMANPFEFETATTHFAK